MRTLSLLAPLASLVLVAAPTEMALTSADGFGREHPFKFLAAYIKKVDKGDVACMEGWTVEFDKVEAWMPIP